MAGCQNHSDQRHQAYNIDLDWSKSISAKSGTRKLPEAEVMAFDEGHFNVHTAEGSYRPFADLARASGMSVVRHRGEFTAESLSRYAVLVIGLARGAGNDSPLEDRGKTAFALNELETVTAWVDNGGALLLVFDHWPTGAANAALAQALGVSLTDGSTYDSALFDSAEGTIVFDRAKAAIGNHPITCGSDSSERINRVATFTGASMKGPANASPLLLFSREAVDLLGKERIKRSASGRSQGLAFCFGKGRVVILGEAAMLRIFDNPSVQNRQFAKNLIAWLSGKLKRESAKGCQYLEE